MRRDISVDELIKFLNPESNYVFYDDAHGFCINTQDVIDHLRAMPSADVQPEITLESAIDYLHSIGWMQEHDRILSESAQPQRPKGHWIFDFAHNEMTCSECGRTFTGGFDLENADNFCRHCGSDNRGEQDGKTN